MIVNKGLAAATMISAVLVALLLAGDRASHAVSPSQPRDGCVRVTAPVNTLLPLIALAGSADRVGAIFKNEGTGPASISNAQGGDLFTLAPGEQRILAAVGTAGMFVNNVNGFETAVVLVCNPF